MIPPTPARPLITETLVNTNSRETHLATNNSTGRRNNGLSSADVTLRRLVTLVLGAGYKYSYIHTYITICRARCVDSTETNWVHVESEAVLTSLLQHHSAQVRISTSTSCLKPHSHCAPRRAQKRSNRTRRNQGHRTRSKAVTRNVKQQNRNVSDWS